MQASYSGVDGEELRYLVWLPDGYGENRSKKHPMIVFLHGSGDDDYDSEFVAGSGLPAVLAQEEQPVGFDFVVISPQAQPGAVWYSPGLPELVDRMVQDVLDTYLVEPDRVYLTGLSMGGYGSWHLATRFPGRYAGVVSVSGSGYQTESPPPADFACRLLAVPVWGIHGEGDLIARYEPIRRQISAWENLCGGEVKWTSYPDDGHFSTYEKAYRDPALYEWMLEQGGG